MRFAYIDSQGKEVGIPSVEALQLRIELGAIVETTEFFDGNADRWAPAGEHEIFRTLSRELKEREEGTFVAPPPPAPSSGAGESEEEDTSDEEVEAPAQRPRAPNPFAREEGPSEPEPEDPEAEETPSFDPPGMEMEAPTVPADEEPAQDEKEDDGDFDFGGFGSLDLVDDMADEEPEAPADFGSLSLADDDEDEDEAEDDDEEEEDAGFDMGGFGSLEFEDDDEEDEEEEDPADSGLELEQSFADQHDAPSSMGQEEGLELESSLSDYSPEEPPSWMTEEEDDGGDEEEEDSSAEPVRRSRSSASSDEDEEEESADEAVPQASTTRGRAPVSRGRKEKSGLGGALAAVLVLAALGGAGWFGWNALQGGEEAEPVETAPAVAIPDIDPGLEPRMRELGRMAYVQLLDSLRLVAAAQDLPAEPNPDWLSGEYLGNASRFDDVEQYWLDLQDAVAELQAAEEGIFVQRLEPLLDLPELDPEERDQIRARAVAGFQAAAGDRDQVYQQFRTLAEASLGLHEFLLGNEDQIDYTPAAGGLSRDPVVEAVPSSPALGEEMWNRMGEIPDALDDLGALDRVNTERLVDLLIQKLDATPIR